MRILSKDDWVDFDVKTELKTLVTADTFLNHKRIFYGLAYELQELSLAVHEVGDLNFGKKINFNDWIFF